MWTRFKLSSSSLLCSPQEAAKMEKRTSVMNEGTVRHHTIEKNKPILALFLGGMENCWIRTDDAVCRANRGCFSQAELFFTYTEMAMRTMAASWLWANKTDEAQSPVWATSPLQLHQCVWFQFSAIPLREKKTCFFLNVCFKDSSSTFQVFGCFFLLCVQVHSFSRTSATPKKKKKENKTMTLCSEFNTLGWQTYHYSQIGISSFDFSRPKTEHPSFVLFFFSNIVSFLLRHVVRLFQWLPFFFFFSFWEEWFVFSQPLVGC